MAEIPLITITQVQEYRNISHNIKSDKFDAYVTEAQRKNLRILLGQPLYYDLFDNVTDINNIASPYDDLVNGKEYEYSGETIQYYGLKPFIIYHFLAIYAREGNLFRADYGNVNFSNNPQQNFESASERKNIMQSHIESANEYRNDIIQFLSENSSTYSLWEGGKKINKTKFNIITI